MHFHYRRMHLYTLSKHTQLLAEGLHFSAFLLKTVLIPGQGFSVILSHIFFVQNMAHKRYSQRAILKSICVELSQKSLNAHTTRGRWSVHIHVCMYVKYVINACSHTGDYLYSDLCTSWWIVSRARRMLRALKRGGGGGNIHLMYLDRFLCALPECWQYQSDCSIG